MSEANAQPMGLKRTPVADLIQRAGYDPLDNRLKDAWERRKGCRRPS